MAAPAATGVGRIDRAALLSARYPFSVVMPVRYGDLDPHGHVNNAAAVALLQEARAQVMLAKKLPIARDFGLRPLMVAVAVEYAGEVRFPGNVEVRTGLLAIGTSSLTFGQLLLQDDRPCVFSVATQTTCDSNGPVPLPDAMRREHAERSMLSWPENSGA